MTSLVCKIAWESPGDIYKIYFILALLSHQMDQLMKLNAELSEGKKEVDSVKVDIKGLEQELKNQEMMLQCHAPKLVVSFNNVFTF